MWPQLGDFGWPAGVFIFATKKEAKPPATCLSPEKGVSGMTLFTFLLKSEEAGPSHTYIFAIGREA